MLNENKKFLSIYFMKKFQNSTVNENFIRVTYNTISRKKEEILPVRELRNFHLFQPVLICYKILGNLSPLS